MGLEEFMNCTYKLESSDNLEAFLLKTGHSGDIAKAVAADDSATVTFSINSDGLYTFVTKSKLHNDTICFKPGEECEHTTPYGKTYKGIVTVSGNKTTHVSSDNPSAIMTSEFEDDRLIITLQEDGEKATRIFRRV